MTKPVKMEPSVIKKEQVGRSGHKDSFDLSLPLHVKQHLQAVKVEKDDSKIDRQGERRPKWVHLGQNVMLCGANEGVLSWLRRKMQTHELLMSSQ